MASSFEEISPVATGDDAGQTMAALLEADTATYPHLRRGAIVEGTVVGVDRHGVLVDLGAKSEGIIPPSEMHTLGPEGHTSLHTGDKLMVFVIQPESMEGQVLLSLDRARGEQGWRTLQDYGEQGVAFEARITGYNRGGVLANVEGVSAFIPASQLVSRGDRPTNDAGELNLGDMVGKNIMVKVIEVNRRRNRAILSERAATSERRAQDKDRLLKELHEGDIRTGRITSIRDFGIFVDIGGADGLVHLSEVSWQRTPKSLHEDFRVGSEIEVYVMRVDHETKKIALSLRRTQHEPWEEIVGRYREGQIVTGQISKLASFGAFVQLEGPIEGLIHISELVDRRVQHPKEVVHEGDLVPVKILRIEHDRHRLALSLQQARDNAEDEGWSFNDDGRVKSVPDELRAAFAAGQAADGITPVEAEDIVAEEDVVASAAIERAAPPEAKSEEERTDEDGPSAMAEALSALNIVDAGRESDAPEEAEIVADAGIEPAAPEEAEIVADARIEPAAPEEAEIVADAGKELAGLEEEEAESGEERTAENGPSVTEGALSALTIVDDAEPQSEDTAASVVDSGETE